MSPTLQDEVYRIGREVLRNAFRHAHARHIEAEIRYDKRDLRLRIRDDSEGLTGRSSRKVRRPGTGACRNSGARETDRSAIRYLE